MVGRLTDASNATFLCDIADAESGGGGEPIRVVYKPVRGERPLDDFPIGTLASREAAAFVLSEATGWNVVPPTFLRDGPFGLGAVQQWIDVDEEADVFEMIVTSDVRLRHMAIFDVLANNADRKGGHCLLDADGNVWLIDHGVCFAVEPKLRTVIWTFVGEPLPQDAAADLARVHDELAAGLGVAMALRSLLDPAEVEAVRKRIERLLAGYRFPEPEPGVRPYPWPPI